MEVVIQSDELNTQGMVIDFQHVKEVIKKLDHIHLNSEVKIPTAEHVAKKLFWMICSLIDGNTYGNKHASIKSLTLFETPSGSVTIYP